MVPAESLQPAVDRRVRILVVEDDFSVRWPIAEFLRDAGFQVIEAESANEAIAVLLCGTPLDLVFSDVQLTGELTGHMLARWIGKAHPRIPVLLTSSDSEAKRQMIPGPLRAFIAKPYDPHEVTQRLRALLPPR